MALSSEDEDDDEEEDEAAADREHAERHEGQAAAEVDRVAAAQTGGGAERAGAGGTTAGAPGSGGGFRNKEKVLILSSRGIPHRCFITASGVVQADDTQLSSRARIALADDLLGLVLQFSQRSLA
jgi:hypothetical protein